MLLAMQAMARSHTILIVKSSDNRFFNRSIDSFVKHAGQQFKYRIATFEQLQKQPSLMQDIDVMVTLGIRAADYSAHALKSTPVLHSYITEQQYLDHQRNDNHHSILLNQPLQRYLRFIKLLTNAHSVGILRNERQALSQRTLDALQQKLDIQIQQALLDDDANPINAARDILHNNDVLLALPNPRIYNRRTLKGILLTSYRQRKPLITYSPAQVKSGALGAIYSTPENIGQQLAEIIKQMLQPAAAPPAAFYYARYFDIKINRRVAESLELNIASKETLLKLLQQQD
jgi:ABC-type uncharacterized transport system substrate-binding protein